MLLIIEVALDTTALIMIIETVTGAVTAMAVTAGAVTAVVVVVLMVEAEDLVGSSN